MNERDINRSMYDYLPGYYEDIREARAIVDAESGAFKQFNADAADVLAQFYIDTATWGLANWERLCGIPVNESKPINQRRELLRSKLRGIGTVSVGMIKIVAESYANGEVVVVEDSPNYTISVKFVGKLGVPANLADIQKVLRDIIPAHLIVGFEFTYVTYAQTKSKYASYSAMKATGLTYGEILTTT